MRKLIQKIAAFGIAGAMMFISMGNYALAADAPSATPARTNVRVTAIKEGTLADPKYAFTIKPNSDTKVESFGMEGDYCHKYDSRRIFLYPHSDDKSGKIGVWIKNVGKYRGKIVDVKCTLMWNALKIGGKSIFPCVLIDCSRNDAIDIGYHNRNVQMRYELYSDGEPIKVCMSLNFQDVDGYQWFGLKLANGRVNDIQCLEDCTILFAQNNGWNLMDSQEGLTDGIPQTSLRFEIEDTSSFDILYNLPRDATYHTVLNSYSYSQGMRSDSWMEYVTDKVNESWTGMLNGDQQAIQYMIKNPSHAWFTSDAYGPYDICEPVLTVSDSDEKKVYDNTLNSEEVYTYDVIHFVPPENEGFLYKKYVMCCEIPKETEYISAKVLGKDKDVTDMFDIRYEDGVVSAVAKPEITSDVKSNFYDNEYDLFVTVKLLSKESVVIPNVAKVLIDNGEDHDMLTNQVVSRFAPPEPVTQEPTTEAPTEAPTEALTSEVPPTQAPTQEMTTEVPPTEEPTQEPTTEAPTEAPTQEPTTEKPTQVPTTEAPTQKPPTQAPTTAEPATEVPSTVVPTQVPTTTAITEEPGTEPLTEEPTTEEITSQAEPTKNVTEEPTSKSPLGDTKGKASGSLISPKTGMSIFIPVVLVAASLAVIGAAIYKTTENKRKK